MANQKEPQLLPRLTVFSSSYWITSDHKFSLRGASSIVVMMSHATVLTRESCSFHDIKPGLHRNNVVLSKSGFSYLVFSGKFSFVEACFFFSQQEQDSD